MSKPWFRLYHEFATDPKVQMLSEKDQRRYIMLLCLRCCNDDVTLQDEAVSFQLRISNEEWKDTKSVLMSKNLINDESKPIAWDKRQFVSDSSSARVAKHRANKKRRCNVTVTSPDTDTDTEEQIQNNNIPSKNKKNAIQKPDSVSEEVWQDFLSHRKTKKSPLTTTALKRIQAEAEKAGWDLESALSESIARGWTGFKAEWVENNQSKSDKTEPEKSFKNFLGGAF